MYRLKKPCQVRSNHLLNYIGDTFQRMALGALGWDTIILTGGGRALLYERLLPILDHQHVILANETESLHLANGRGGSKL